MRSTSATLLGRLRDLSDKQAWQEFQAHYTPRLLAWCHSKGLQPADAQDVVQDVLVRVARCMEKLFVYDPLSNFSGWLRRVWYTAWCDFTNQRTPGGRGTGDSKVHEQLQHVPGGDLTKELEQEFQREVLEEALERTRPHVSPRDYAIFLDFLGGKPASELAKEHKLTLAALGMVKKRVQRKVCLAIATLERTGPEEGKDEP